MNGSVDEKAGIVAEEHDRQDVRIPTTIGSASRADPAVNHWELKSDRPSRFRQFQVKVAERIAPIVKP
jgi:hypothetical protein